MAAGVPRVALADALENEPNAFETSILTQGVQRILGAVRVKPAALPEQGTYRILVEADQA